MGRRTFIKEIFYLGKCPMTPFRGFRERTPVKSKIFYLIFIVSQIICKVRDRTEKSVSQNQEVLHQTIKELGSKLHDLHIQPS